MKYRNLGSSGLRLSEIAIGSWMTALSTDSQREVAENTLRSAYENGVNFFDCADGYSGGEAEKFLGTILKSYQRGSYVVSSKVYFPVGESEMERGLSRKHIFDNIDRSLKNLETDYIDIYFCHRFDTTTPLDETLRALSDLVSQGKILYYGVSENWTAARLVEAQKIIEKYQLHPLTAIQPQYHMMDRYIEHEIMDVCEKFGIGITPFSPLAQGLLTGKYKKGQAYPEGSRATFQYDKQVNRLLTEENLDKVEKLGKIADELNITMSVLALAWILNKPLISSVITGASNPNQLLSNLAASGFTISKEVDDQIEKILNFERFERNIG